MARGLSATQRTLKAMREQGRLVDVAERWIPNPAHPGGGFRKDLFGFIDLIVIDPEEGILAIQSCGQSFKAHVDKILDSECTELAIEWLRHAKLELWGWRKVKLRPGAKAMRWKPRIGDFYLKGDDIKFKERK